MLTNTQIFENKSKFVKILSTLNADITEIMSYLDSKDYFNLPLNSETENYTGGMCQHALYRLVELTQLCSTYCPPNCYTEDTLIKVALLTDLYKFKMAEQPLSDLMTDKSALSNLIDLKDVELDAIVNFQDRHHISPEKIIKNRLIALLIMADIAATYLD